MLLYYCDPYDIPLPTGHKFPMEKYRLLREQLGGNSGFRFEIGPFAQTEDLLRVHEQAYVERFLAAQLDAQEVRRIGFPNVPQLITRTLSSVGATVEAAQVALREGVAGVLAGGTHHAHRTFGSGFCVFNDIAAAAARLLDEGKVERVAVVDLDVHQGDGTATIFAGDPRVFTFSAHGRHNFPFRKEQSNLDLAFENGTEGEEYLAALPAALEQVFATRPQIVFYQAGVDALATDKLGKLALAPADLLARDHLVFHECRRRGVPVAITLGGGYSDPITHTVAAAAQTYKLARTMVA
ncbi:MAG: histone deacetylase [Bryobacter sp.]|nr:histone deacetylase [Bryobacter sp.]